MKIKTDNRADPQEADLQMDPIADGASLRDAIEAAINRRLAKKLGCKPEEVDLMLPSGSEEETQ
jgi:hypothetical protein